MNETKESEKHTAQDRLHKKLDKLYNDPNSAAAYAGVDRLWQEAKKQINPSISKKDVQFYLEGHRVYTLMRPRRVHFPKQKTIAAGFMTDVSVDLADLSSLSRSNGGYKYILLAIDVLSKRIFVVPLRSKKSEEMVRGFEQLIEQIDRETGIKPFSIYSDLGTEFRNKQLKEFFEREDIQKHQASSTFNKAWVAERAIQNLKQRLYRYFSQNKRLNWIDVLQKIADGINHSKSRVHGMRPVDVNFKNAQQVWKTIYGDEFSTKKRKTHPKFKKGDFVRLSRGKGIFEKGYIPSWSDEILEIDTVKDQSKPIRYKIRDEKGEKFKGTFYGEELSHVRKEAATKYRIEKILRKRKLPDGTKEALVKFIGYPDAEWIHESEIV